MHTTFAAALRLIARAESSIDDEINAVRSGDAAAARFHGRAAVRRQKAAARLLDAVDRAFDGRAA